MDQERVSSPSDQTGMSVPVTRRTALGAAVLGVSATVLPGRLAAASALEGPYPAGAAEGGVISGMSDESLVEYRIHTFNDPASNGQVGNRFVVAVPMTVDLLLIGGGGGGGGGGNGAESIEKHGGGGGAGGLRVVTGLTLMPDTYDVTVGAPGAGGSGSSGVPHPGGGSFGSGGGGGGESQFKVGITTYRAEGGSGGGASTDAAMGPAAGGAAGTNTTIAPAVAHPGGAGGSDRAGGGGGAGGPGQSGDIFVSMSASTGGAGIYEARFDIVTLAGGGGGGVGSGFGPGLDGGGDGGGTLDAGPVGGAAVSGTGGGGGGARGLSEVSAGSGGGAGGSGRVAIRYRYDSPS